MVKGGPMKRVWIAAVIGLFLVFASVYYAYDRRQATKALKEHVSTVMATPAPVQVSTLPETKALYIESESNPLNLDTDTIAEAEKECCPEEEISEMLEAHATEHDRRETTNSPVNRGSTDDGLTREQRFRRSYVRKWGDTAEVHTYVDLLMKQLDNKPFSFEDMLTWARLYYYFEPTEQNKEFLDSMERIARVPEDMRTYEQIE